MPEIKEQFVIAMINYRFIVTKMNIDIGAGPSNFNNRKLILRNWFMPDIDRILIFDSKNEVETYYENYRDFFEIRNFKIMPYNQEFLNDILYLKLRGI